MARPHGAARGSASAILSMPELTEKRTVTGTSCLKCNALLTLAASALGTNLPSRTTPLAWADRCVVCLPNAALSASTNDSGVVAIPGFFRLFIAVLRWNDLFPRATRRGSWRSSCHERPITIGLRSIAGLDGFLILSHARLRPCWLITPLRDDALETELAGVL